MDKQAFKQRMQNLKSYRESNPDKGYWDWKVQAFVGGGENQTKSNSKQDNSTTYDTNIQQSLDILAKWLKLQTLRMKYPERYELEKAWHSSSNPRLSLMDYLLDGNDKNEKRYTGSWSGEKVIYEDNATRSSEQKANEGRDFVNNYIYGLDDGFEKLNAKPIIINGDTLNYRTYKGDFIQSDTLHVNSKFKNSIDSLINEKDILGFDTPTITSDKFQDNVARYNGTFSKKGNKYYLNAFDIWDFDKDFGKRWGIYDPVWNYIYKRIENITKPTKDIPNSGPFMLKQSVPIEFDDSEQTNYPLNNLIKSGKHYKLFNSNVESFVEGGETGQPNEEFTKALNNKLGRTSSGRPIEQGLKSVFDLRDAADFTPIGDALAVKDTYEAVQNKDWSSAALASLGVLPFVPNALHKVKSVKRPIPTVNKNTQELIDAKLNELEAYNKVKAEVSNEQYKVIERMMEDPSYIKRAEEVKANFGDDYTMPYADAFMAYNINPDVLPQVTLIDDLTRAGYMSKTIDGGFVYGRNIDRSVPNVTEHELSHFTDLLKSGSTDAEVNNNLFYQMSKDLSKKVDKYDGYYSMPTEQKAHMNQLREWMFQNNYLKTRDQKITPEQMSKVMSDIKDNKGMSGVNRAAKQFKSNKTYTKWFNSIPLIGLGTLPVNSYLLEEDNKSN